MGLRKASPIPAQPRPCSESGALESLLRQLADQSSEERRHAARRLSIHPEAAAPLVSRLAEETEPDVREAIATSLSVIGGAQTVEGLIPHLTSDDAALRNTAIEILQHLPADVAERIDSLLASPEPDLRIFAVNIMEALSHPRIEEWLAGILRGDSDVNVVGAALNLLSEVATESILPVVEEARARFASEPYIAFVCQAVGKRVRGDVNAGRMHFRGRFPRVPGAVLPEDRNLVRR
jgi:HEAT repeat protein